MKIYEFSNKKEFGEIIKKTVSYMGSEDLLLYLKISVLKPNEKDTNIIFIEEEYGYVYGPLPTQIEHLKIKYLEMRQKPFGDFGIECKMFWREDSTEIVFKDIPKNTQNKYFVSHGMLDADVEKYIEKKYPEYFV